MAENKNIAARAARWSASHRKTAIWGWLAFVIVLVMVGGAIGTKSAEQDEGGPGESGRADKTLHDAFPKAADESVLVQSGRYTAGDPQFRRRGAGCDGDRRRTGARARGEEPLPVR